jgi:hypothetical protein
MVQISSIQPMDGSSRATTSICVIGHPDGTATSSELIWTESSGIATMPIASSSHVSNRTGGGPDFTGAFGATGCWIAGGWIAGGSMAGCVEGGWNAGV